MPEQVKTKYKRDLLDADRAIDFLFELRIAWYYFLKGYEIHWYQENNCPEFLIKTPGLKFNVECKRVSVDNSRKIWRKDLYRFADLLIPQINAKKIKGRIDIELDGRLESDIKSLELLTSQIVSVIERYSKGTFPIPLGEVTIDFENEDGTVVDLNLKYKNLWERKSQEAHGVIFTKSKSQKPVDPIELTIKSRKTDTVLNGIKKKIKLAGTNQLPISTPGIVVCFLEGITKLDELAGNSGLQVISDTFLQKKEAEHIPAIFYCSDQRFYTHGNYENYDFQGLVFRNPNCSFPEFKKFKF